MLISAYGCKPLPGLPSPDPLRGRSSPSQHLAASERSSSSANLATKMHKTALSTSTQEIHELVICLMFLRHLIFTSARWERNLSQSAAGRRSEVCVAGVGGLCMGEG